MKNEKVRIGLSYSHNNSNKEWYIKPLTFNKYDWPKEIVIDSLQQCILSYLINYVITKDGEITVNVLDFSMIFKCVYIQLFDEISNEYISLNEIIINIDKYECSFNIEVSSSKSNEMFKSNCISMSKSKTTEVLFNNLTTIMLQINNSYRYDYIGPKSFQIIGNEGSGKSYLLNQLMLWSENHNINCVYISINDLLNKKVDESMTINYDDDLHTILYSILKHFKIYSLHSQSDYQKLTIVMIDDINFIDNSNSNLSNILIILQSYINLVKSTDSSQIVIGSTRLFTNNILNLEKTLHISKPDCFDRFTIISDYLINYNMEISNLPDVAETAKEYYNHSLPTDINDCSLRLADLTNGYLPGDLINIIEKSKILEIGSNNLNLTDTLLNNIISWENILIAYNMTVPKQIKEIDDILSIDSSDSHRGLFNKLSWDDYCGYSDIKNKLKNIIFRNNKKVNNCQGVVLHGPSGCGKTYLASIIASEIKMNYISIKSTDLLSKYYGETEMKIRQIFKHARFASPVVLFFDEFDAISCKRSIDDDSTDNELNTRILSTLLNELDGISSTNNINYNIIIIIACEDINLLDEALLRPGRLQYHMHIQLPTAPDIYEMFQRKFKYVNSVDNKINENAILCKDDVNFYEIINVIFSFNNYPTCELIDKIFKKAIFNAIHEEIINKHNESNHKNRNDSKHVIKNHHFVNAIQEIFNV